MGAELILTAVNNHGLGFLLESGRDFSRRGAGGRGHDRHGRDRHDRRPLAVRAVATGNSAAVRVSMRHRKIRGAADFRFHVLPPPPILHSTG